MDSESGFSLRKFVHVLFKKKRFILLFLLGTVAAASVVAVKFLRPQYVATAQLMVISTGDQGLDSSLIPTPGVPPARFVVKEDERAARSVEILTGRTLAELLVKSIGADALYPLESPSILARLLDRVTQRVPASRDEAAIEELRTNLQANVSWKSGWITLEFKHPNAVMATRVVNELTNLYMERYTGMRRNERAESFIREQVGVLKGELDRASKELESFKSTHQITASAKDDQELALRQLSAAQSEANEIGNREAELASRVENLRGQVARARRELTEMETQSGPGRAAGTSAASLRERLAALEMKEGEMSESYTAEYPPLQSVRSEILTLRAKLAKLQPDAGSGASGSPMDEATFRFLREELLRNESELASVKAKRASQMPQISAIRGKIGDMDRLQGEYERLQQQVQVARDNYRQYLASAEQARIGRAMDAEKIADVRVVESARVPIRPERSKGVLIVALAVFLGLVGGVAIALVVELSAGNLETVEDVEGYLAIPVLASVPPFASGSAEHSRAYRRAARSVG